MSLLAALLLAVAGLGQPVLADVVDPETGCCSVTPISALDDVVGAVWPNRIAGAGGVDLLGGARGVPANSGRGLTHDLPEGTAGIDPRVTQIGVMDLLTTGAHPKPNGYVAYMNETGQTVNPLTGQTVARSDPFAHIELPG